MKPEANFDDEELLEVDEYDDEQYESSTATAAAFVDETILPLIDQFDYENPDPEYVPGCATFGLFTRVVGILAESGFTPEELKATIDDFVSPSAQGETLH
jgi:hypothetical protein